MINITLKVGSVGGRLHLLLPWKIVTFEVGKVRAVWVTTSHVGM